MPSYALTQSSLSSTTSATASVAAAASACAATDIQSLLLSTSSIGNDSYYRYDATQVEQQRRERQWEKSVHHFSKCKVSALAAMKMLKHSLLGVEKGRALNGTPIEIMGLMIGKVVGDTIVVLDSCPLPVEGSETRVVADDAQTHMVELLEAMEQRRPESFVGWYHSHPFDLESYSHCHLSAIDVQTQTVWQNASPVWTAIVVDPLRSQHRQQPEMQAFRVYPPNYNPPTNHCPDFSTTTDQHKRTQRWGLSADRYFQLSISFFTSTLSAQFLQHITQQHVWMPILANDATTDAEQQQAIIERLKRGVEQLSGVDVSDGHLSARAAAAMHSYTSKRMLAQTTKLHTRNVLSGTDANFTASAALLSSVARDECKCCLSQLIRDELLNWLYKRENKLLDKVNAVQQHLEANS